MKLEQFRCLRHKRPSAQKIPPWQCTPPTPPKFDAGGCTPARFVRKVGVYFAAQESPRRPANIELWGCGGDFVVTKSLVQVGVYFADTGTSSGSGAGQGDGKGKPKGTISALAGGREASRGIGPHRRT